MLAINQALLDKLIYLNVVFFWSFLGQELSSNIIALAPSKVPDSVLSKIELIVTLGTELDIQLRENFTNNEQNHFLCFCHCVSVSVSNSLSLSLI